MKTYKPFRVQAVAAALITWGLTLPGCESDWKASTVPTTGKVTINGRPPKGLLVQLHPTGAPVDARNSRAWGKVQDDGTFSLSAYEDREGVPPGEYAVTLIWPVDSSVLGSPDRLGHRYDRPEKSQWKVKVEPGSSQELPPIDLTGVAIKEKPKVSAAEARVVAP